VAKGIGQTVMDGDIKNVIDKNAGLFLHCKVHFEFLFREML